MADIQYPGDICGLVASVERLFKVFAAFPHSKKLQSTFASNQQKFHMWAALQGANLPSHCDWGKSLEDRLRDDPDTRDRFAGLLQDLCGYLHEATKYRPRRSERCAWCVFHGAAEPNSAGDGELSLDEYLFSVRITASNHPLLDVIDKTIRQLSNLLQNPTLVTAMTERRRRMERGNRDAGLKMPKPMKIEDGIPDYDDQQEIELFQYVDFAPFIYHMRKEHWRVWECRFDACATRQPLPPTFSSRASFEEHLRVAHPLVARIFHHKPECVDCHSLVDLDKVVGACPACGGGHTVTSGELNYARHVGDHLEHIAFTGVFNYQYEFREKPMELFCEKPVKKESKDVSWISIFRGSRRDEDQSREEPAKAEEEE
ncbi:hypothetical protein B0T24DRAFT_597043 [Lasiosphaeria ovina]|uniref:C2H2-type domain-containing protein n=1 Tax=Lasiosphaeria ovina TaxID=92902 RepID=A0AAE0K025_9PEZI|nr:hypothetical protein B0T24DRAFT_597043 [Lasiosphaeria ovina]